MKTKNIEQYEFISLGDENIEIVFSTSKGDLNFNRANTTGLENINRIKKWFSVNKVGYLNQTHSDWVINYNGTVKDGDALITNIPKVAIGVFTADCVPVILYDEAKKIISAVHSGWQGTLNCIVLKAVKEMEKLYGTNAKDVKAYIGPHNRGCCYEFGQELADSFYKVSLYKNLDLYKSGKLNNEKCIIAQLESAGVKNTSIKCLEICTFCNGNYKLFSHRKGDSGRMFSFAYIKK
ncbi:MAG: peptidoglycan editing factor PgeF [Bacillota bacterium]|nr:peptidoglycan editing factor PgeF [Bacillota bacterium]